MPYAWRTTCSLLTDGDQICGKPRSKYLELLQSSMKLAIDIAQLLKFK